MPERINLFEEFNKLQRQIDGIQGQAVRKIAREYANALEELRNVVRKKYDEYGEEGQLTYEKMVKYDRIKKFDKEVAEKVRQMHVQTSKITRRSLRKTYKTSFNSVRGSIGKAADRTIQGKIKQEVINEAIQNPVSGLTLNDRLRKRRREIITDIQETIGQGLYKGESYTEMSGRLKETLEGDVTKSRRIVRTESHRVMEKSKVDSVEYASNQGVEMEKYWQDSEDERVRTAHDSMGEKYSEENSIPVDENFVNDITGGEGSAPGQLGVAKDDIHCRCIMVVIVVNEEDEVEAEAENEYREKETQKGV